MWEKKRFSPLNSWKSNKKQWKRKKREAMKLAYKSIVRLYRCSNMFIAVVIFHSSNQPVCSTENQLDDCCSNRYKSRILLADESTIWKGHSTISNKLSVFFLDTFGWLFFIQSVNYLILDRFSLNSSSLFNFSHVPRCGVKNGWIYVSKITSSHLEQYTNTRRR